METLASAFSPSSTIGAAGPIYITDYEQGELRTICVSPSCPPAMHRNTWCLADFELIKELYRGKSSVLFKAIDKNSGITVALKLYRKRKLSILNKFQVEREIRIHISLEHENTIQLYAVFEDARHVYMVQEFADLGDLFEDLKRSGGQYKERQAMRDIIYPFMESLTYLHSLNIIHRDIKPENILLTRDRVVKLADFGLSINFTEERPVTRAGTLDYMAPETLVCPDKKLPHENKDNKLIGYTTLVDSWAVGVLAYELVVGYPPFEHESRAQTYEHIMYRPPVFPSWMSDDAKDFISFALNKNSSLRPQIKDLMTHPWVLRHVPANIPDPRATGEKGEMFTDLSSLQLSPRQCKLQQLAPPPLMLYSSKSNLSPCASPLARWDLVRSEDIALSGRASAPIMSTHTTGSAQMEGQLRESSGGISSMGCPKGAVQGEASVLSPNQDTAQVVGQTCHDHLLQPSLSSGSLLTAPTRTSPTGITPMKLSQPNNQVMSKSQLRGLSMLGRAPSPAAQMADYNTGSFATSLNALKFSLRTISDLKESPTSAPILRGSLPNLDGIRECTSPLKTALKSGEVSEAKQKRFMGSVSFRDLEVTSDPHAPGSLRSSTPSVASPAAAARNQRLLAPYKSFKMDSTQLMSREDSINLAGLPASDGMNSVEFKQPASPSTQGTISSKTAATENDSSKGSLNRANLSGHHCRSFKAPPTSSTGVLQGAIVTRIQQYFKAGREKESR